MIIRLILIGIVGICLFLLGSNAMACDEDDLTDITLDTYTPAPGYTWKKRD